MSSLCPRQGLWCERFQVSRQHRLPFRDTFREQVHIRHAKAHTGFLGPCRAGRARPRLLGLHDGRRRRSGEGVRAATAGGHPHRLHAVRERHDRRRDRRRGVPRHVQPGLRHLRPSRLHPLWGGTAAVSGKAVAARVEALTATGADARVSFGGAAGTEAALTCDSARELADAYADVLDAVGATKADFDIEGDALTDTASVTRRNEALALLQDERDLDVTYTLPVMPDGLEDTGTAVLEDAADQGVEVSAVNIMAMNYSTSHDGDMGDYAESAARAAHDQLVDLLGLSRDAAWKALHITVMIGVNDVEGETFTLDDAASLRSFAARQGVGALSLWAAFRDRPCASDEGTATASDSCSGVDQEAGAFAEALSG